MTDQEATSLCQMAACPDSARVQQFKVWLSPRGFVVIDTHDTTGEGEQIVRGTFAARFKAQQVCDQLNTS